MSATSRHVKIAVSSPDLLAHIRREFAGKGLSVQVEGLPVVDVRITGEPDDEAVTEALLRLAGPDTYRRGPAIAHYRFTLVPARPPQKTVSPQAEPRQEGPVEIPFLSRREAQVMESISQGMRNGDIATSLRVTEKTVKNHVNRIFTKLGVRTRVEAVLLWQQAQPAEAAASRPVQ
ncbi:MAG TPA: LuxR C-terminal-related transcriptional regulator [Actinoplanes sp.]